MKITDRTKNISAPAFSFEIIPPLRGGSGKDITDTVEQLLAYQPLFIDVTSHQAEAVYEELEDGQILRRVRRKRPGTIGISGVVQNRYKIDTVAHILCRGFTREETEDALIELNYLGIQNVMALRGDEANYKKLITNGRSSNTYALDLVKQIANLRKGIFNEPLLNSSPIDFCIGVAGYPEKHFEAPNMKVDIAHLKAKIDAGADYIITQMFFNNEKFYRFEEACRKEGITVPIIPGLKAINTLNHLKSLPKTFHVDLPVALTDQIMARPSAVKNIGKAWALKQIRDLNQHGFPHIHFYVMNDAQIVGEIIKTL